MKTDVDVDTLLVEGVEAMEEYLGEHEVACAKLKQGFLMLTKAKLRLPEHALTEISFHEEFEASRMVTMDSDGNWRLRDASEKLQEGDKKNGDDLVHHRRPGKSKQEEPTSTKSSKAGSKADTLLWFSSLPPSDLRQAQKLFSSGLQALLVAAASAQKTQRAVQGVTSAPR